MYYSGHKCFTEWQPPAHSIIYNKYSEDPGASQKKALSDICKKPEAILEYCLAKTKEVLKALVLQLNQIYCLIVKNITFVHWTKHCWVIFVF